MMHANTPRQLRELTSTSGTRMFEIYEGRLLLAMASTKEEAEVLMDTSRPIRG